VLISKDPISARFCCVRSHCRQSHYNLMRYSMQTLSIYVPFELLHGENIPSRVKNRKSNACWKYRYRQILISLSWYIYDSGQFLPWIFGLFYRIVCFTGGREMRRRNDFMYTGEYQMWYIVRAPNQFPISNGFIWVDCITEEVSIIASLRSSITCIDLEWYHRK
jgi:hypothetical protein